MCKRQHTALTQHDVVVELLRQSLIEFQREVVQPRTFGVKVVGPHDGGVAAGIATAYPTSLQNRYVCDAVIGCPASLKSVATISIFEAAVSSVFSIVTSRRGLTSAPLRLRLDVLN